MLTYAGNSIALPEGTPGMSQFKAYTVFVFATDFLGVMSQTVELVIRKVLRLS